VPEVSKYSSSGLQVFLLSHSGDFLNYAMSFILLAFFWLVHHQQFHHVERTDTKFLWINIVILMLVALMPFSTSLVNDFSKDWAAELFFDFNMFFLSMLFLLSWVYSTSEHRLVNAGLDQKHIKIGTRRSLIVPIACLLAIGLNFITPEFSGFAYLAIFILLQVPYFKHVKQGG
ncbi:MAG: TMEM175 family protein, partial [Candidatus Saganbacteria bacterium]|nr:TMEM175 family protein [Candidatus Saganbacteria bacterium]